MMICNLSPRISKKHRKTILGVVSNRPRLKNEPRMKMTFEIFVLVTLYRGNFSPSETHQKWSQFRWKLKNR